jgi:hypothetical protein
VATWRLTSRRGSEVRKSDFGDLDQAVEAMRAEAAEIVRAGPIGPATGFREYDPGEQVVARLEISSGGLLHRRDAGIDVMGDGAVVPFSGVLRRQRLDGRSPDRAFDAVAEALR